MTFDWTAAGCRLLIWHVLIIFGVGSVFHY